MKTLYLGVVRGSVGIIAARPLARWERVRVRAGLGHFLPVGLIDAAVAEPAFVGFQLSANSPWTHSR